LAALILWNVDRVQRLLPWDHKLKFFSYTVDCYSNVGEIRHERSLHNISQLSRFTAILADYKRPYRPFHVSRKPFRRFRYNPVLLIVMLFRYEFISFFYLTRFAFYWNAVHKPAASKLNKLQGTPFEILYRPTTLLKLKFICWVHRTSKNRVHITPGFFVDHRFYYIMECT
jgi:hypothetical protein